MLKRTFRRASNQRAGLSGKYTRASGARATWNQQSTINVTNIDWQEMQRLFAIDQLPVHMQFVFLVQLVQHHLQTKADPLRTLHRTIVTRRCIDQNLIMCWLQTNQLRVHHFAMLKSCALILHIVKQYQSQRYTSRVNATRISLKLQEQFLEKLATWFWSRLIHAHLSAQLLKTLNIRNERGCTIETWSSAFDFSFGSALFKNKRFYDCQIVSRHCPLVVSWIFKLKQQRKLF